MSIVKRISSWFSSLFKPTQGTTEIFPKLDVDLVARELKIQKLAVEAGSTESPKTDSIELDPNERLIIDYVNQRILSSGDQFQMQMNGYAQRLNSHIALINQDIKGVTQNVLSSIDVQMAKTFDIYQNLKREYDEAQANYDNFRRDNNITRDAKYPRSKINHYGWIVFIFFLELVFNTYFFAQGSDLGFIGGFFESFIIGFFNIFISFFVLGNSIRLLLNSNTYKKITAIAIIASTISLLIAFNLYFAHYRHLFVHDGQSYALANAWSSMKDHLIVTDLHSILLFCTGMFASGISAWKSATSDELIPNYGDLDRTRVQKASQFFEFKELYLDRLTIEKDQKLSALNKAKDDLVLAKDSYAYTLNKKNTFIGLYSSHVNSLSSTGNTLLHKYRSLNIEARQTAPPKHFSDAFVFTPNVGVPPQDDIEVATSELNKNYDASVGEIEKCTQSTYQLFSKYVDKFTSYSNDESIEDGGAINEQS